MPNHVVDLWLDHPGRLWISSINRVLHCVCVFQERDRYAYKIHLPETVEQLRKFNSRRKLKVKFTLTAWHWQCKVFFFPPNCVFAIKQSSYSRVIVFRVRCWPRCPATSSARSMVTHLRSCQISVKIPPHLVLIYHDTVYHAVFLRDW